MLVVFRLILSDNVIKLFLLSLVVINVKSSEKRNIARRSN